MYVSRFQGFREWQDGLRFMGSRHWVLRMAGEIELGVAACRQNAARARNDLQRRSAPPSQGYGAAGETPLRGRGSREGVTQGGARSWLGLDSYKKMAVI
jgi:hypothetical protein